MPRLSKKIKEEMAFFINPTTGKRQYNRRCRHCMHICKQSYRTELLACPKYQQQAVAAVGLAGLDEGRS